MWEGFFGNIINNNIVNNINMGLTGAITALTTSLQPAPRSSSVQTNEKATPIISNPDNYKSLSRDDKILVTLNVPSQKIPLNPVSDPPQPARRNNDNNSRNRSSRPHLSNEFQAALMISAAASKNFYNREDQVDKRKRDKRSAPLKGNGARNAVLIRGIRPTEFQSGDTNLKNIGIELAELEFELSRTKIRKGNLNIVKNSPEFGSHNSRRTKEYRDEGLNIQKNINTLNESLLKFYTKEERAKVDAARINELQRLKNTPSLSPSAPLVATRPSLSHLTRT